MRQDLLSRWELLKHPLQVVSPDVQVEIAPVLIEHPVPRIVDKNHPSRVSRLLKLSEQWQRNN
jgi:hypothetical protein